MSYTNEKRYSLKQIVILLTIAFFMVTVISYAAVTIPNTFTTGTTISSSQVNDNFSALKTAIDALQSVHTGTVSVSSLGAAPRNSTVATNQQNGGGAVGRAAANINSSEYLVAPIHIPDGATITRIDFTCFDNDASHDCSADLYSFTDSTFNTIVQAGTTGTSTTPQKVSLTGFSHVVNNSDAYLVYMSINTSSVGSIIPIKFTVTYTYSL